MKIRKLRFGVQNAYCNTHTFTNTHLAQMEELTHDVKMQVRILQWVINLFSDMLHSGLTRVIHAWIISIDDLYEIIHGDDPCEMTSARWSIVDYLAWIIYDRSSCRNHLAWIIFVDDLSGRHSPIRYYECAISQLSVLCFKIYRNTSLTTGFEPASSRHAWALPIELSQYL